MNENVESSCLSLSSVAVGFDAKRAAQNGVGLGNYSRFVLEGLARYAGLRQLVLFIPNRHKTQCLGQIGSLQRVVLRYPHTSLHKAFSSLWRSLSQSGSIADSGVSLFHGLSNELPLDIHKAQGVRSVVTIHDLIFLRYPQTYKFLDRKIYNYKFRRACELADRVIAVSECTKRDIVDFYHIDPQKIDVVYQGCNQIYYSEVGEDQCSRVRSRYQLPEKYMLFVGTIEERKNLKLVSDALGNLPADVHLVAVGRRTPYAAEVEASAAESGASDRLHFLHGVPTTDLPALYHMARVFVYPSRFEGFGIPVLEALAVGVPVVACVGSALEEAGGPDSLYVSPDDPAALAVAVGRVLTDDTLRSQMSQRGKIYARKFSAEKLTADLIAVYQKTLA